MKRRIAIIFGLLVATFVVPMTSASARPAACINCADVNGADETIDVLYTRGRSDFVPGRGRPEDGEAPGKATWTSVAEEMAPTCVGNTRVDAGVLCGQAVNSCADGQVRFWVWHQVTTFTRDDTGDVTSVVGPWIREPRTYCLGADDPGVPTIARVLDLVRSQFTSLPLRKQTPRADPGPTTLVNIETAFSAGSSEPQGFDPVLLGTQVHVSAQPVRWTWTWGDGTTQSFDRPGTPKQPDVTHTYAKAGDLTASVLVEWRGTFSVGNDPTSYTIQTPAFVRSAPIPVRVREARSQLVR